MTAANDVDWSLTLFTQFFFIIAKQFFTSSSAVKRLFFSTIQKEVPSFNSIPMLKS